jgi:hypothetical protein
VSTCASCGDRIGFYEPIWWQRADGSLTATGLLSLPPEAEAASGGRLFHLGCLAPDGIGNSQER